MTAQEQFAELLRLVAPTLKNAGYSKVGRSTWRRQVGDNYCLINLQGSSWNTRDDGRFTINLGVKSKCLHEVIAGSTRYPPTLEYHCEWRVRIGRLMPGGEDHWWVIDRATRTERLATEIDAILESIAIPYLSNHASDEQLLAAWGNDVAMKAPVGLAVFLKHFGPPHDYEKALNELVRSARADGPAAASLRGLLDRLEPGWQDRLG